MANKCIMLTKPASCGTIERVEPPGAALRPNPPGSGGSTPTEFEVCLMLTRIFLGREDLLVAVNLYKLSRLLSPNKHGEIEEGQTDGSNSNSEA